MTRDREENFCCGRRKLTRIFSPVDLDGVTSCLTNRENPYSDYGPGPHIISGSRLCYPQNFERLISAFKIFQQDHESARLWVLGIKLVSYVGHRLRQ